MKQFEYQVLHVYSEGRIKIDHEWTSLNALGKDGWELVAIWSFANHHPFAYGFFKREIHPESSSPTLPPA